MTVPVQRPDSSRIEFWMPVFQGLRPVLAWRLVWSVRQGSLAGDAESDLRNVLYSHGMAKIRHLQQKLNDGVLFPRCEILLALGLLFY